MIVPTLEPEDRRAIVNGVAIAALSALLTGAIAWGFEEGKRLLAERRERHKAASTSTP